MSEHNEQVALINWWKLQHKKFNLPEYALMANPNGGHRHIAVAKKMKAEGQRRGIPDIQLRISRNGFHALWIEMKVGKNKPTKEQLEFMHWQETEGAKCVVCYSWVEAKQAIEEYLR